MRADLYQYTCDLCGVHNTISPVRKNQTDPVPLPLGWAEVRFDTAERLNIGKHVCSRCVSQIKHPTAKDKLP